MEAFHKCYGNVLWAKNVVPLCLLTEVLPKTLSMFEQNLLEFIGVLKEDGMHQLVFQQDNARPHVAKRTLCRLENTGHEHDFTLIRWPANSPDLNSIENLWVWIKLELHRRYPDTKRNQRRA